MSIGFSAMKQRRLRKNFSQLDLAVDMPNLIQVQKDSYEKNFLQLEVPLEERKNKGIQLVLNSIFPVNTDKATLEFIKYHLEHPKYDVEESKYRSVSYASALIITVRLCLWDIDEETGVKELKGIKEQDVYLGDLPMMTPSGTFILNGIERVVISQIHRSPGVFFHHDEGKGHLSGKFLYFARIIPYRGSWLDFEFDVKDILHFRIDKKRKLLATTLLTALGMSHKEILDFFYISEKYNFLQDDKWEASFVPTNIQPVKLLFDLINADTKEKILAAGQKITPRLARKFAQEGLTKIILNEDEMIGKFLADELIIEDTGEVLAPVGAEITKDLLSRIKEQGIKEISVLIINAQAGPYIRNTLSLDRNYTQETALIDIFRIIRPGEQATFESAKFLLNSLLFDPERYDLSEVGRIKTNSRLNLDVPVTNLTLTIDDIKYVIKSLVNLRDGKGKVDDIDNLSNRRVRSVGELVENQVRLALSKIERIARDRMEVMDIDTIMPYDLINSKTFGSVIKEFFGLSPLSQFMSQANPLAEITHKRKLSALGPGGLSRDRAGFEVRDVHYSHYGRICPIETPEGGAIGLVNALATYSLVDQYGFIKSPYRKVENGFVTDEVTYLAAMEESKYKIARAHTPFGEDRKITLPSVTCRIDGGNFINVAPEQVDFLDVTPMQVVSVAASLIPFLEHDDGNRALMAANMMNQALSLLKSQAPFVGTGIEKVTAMDSGSVVLASYDGEVVEVDAKRIVIKRRDDSDNLHPIVDIYSLAKFQRSNHNTLINQKPLVVVGDIVKKGDIIADGASTDKGEIALGKNVLVAILSFNGYNFEDAIVVSERIVKDDVFTSVHIEELEVIARDTQIGPEVITRDIPNVSDEKLRHLDETGIVYIGAEVKAGDVLVGKITPKSSEALTPEEKLLRSIFGDKALNVKASCLEVPPGVSGTVVDVRIFTRRGLEIDPRSIAIQEENIQKLMRDKEDKIAVIQKFVTFHIKKFLLNHKIVNGSRAVKAGTIIDENLLNMLSLNDIWQLLVEDAEVNANLLDVKEHYDRQIKNITKLFEDKVEKLRAGDDLSQGVLKIVKVYIASKRKIEAGDKMAGRHGNKGVVSGIMSIEEMPFLEDGTPVDIVISPSGIPSRMNIGQVLETHLGWASHNLGKQIDRMLMQQKAWDEVKSEIRDFLKKLYNGKKNFNKNVNIDEISDEELKAFCQEARSGIFFATPIFDGASIEDIKEMLALGGQDVSGQVPLINAQTGEYFDNKVTVGYQYMLKLHHMVEDKIHARSIGPYGLITQQPLGGKAQFGGQRFGEMEVWALEAYGSSYNLREMLTIKSDDVSGRNKIYDSIVRGNNEFSSGIPESLKVASKEVKALCLDFQFKS